MLCPARTGKKINQKDYNCVEHNLKTNENNGRGLRTKGYIYRSTRMTKQDNNEKANAEGMGSI